ncbi:hypothetical protein AND_005477 [Anopheles darlingi]|uniref:Uncharacterized protein n=1 Tax=Anopheles darlingi TaxID=43151 RepID=W5JJ51_ANODA|nr:hypothetical protein AND_005477 [Anopheles darlingi]
MRKQPKLALPWDGTKPGGTPSPPTTEATDSPTQPQDEATVVVVEPFQECNKFETAQASASAAPAVGGGTLTESADDAGVNVTVATQTGHESPDLAFNPDKMTSDKHCYECKVRYRDPKPQDLVMYLHAWKYKGPGWEYETELPEWARVDWRDTDFE